MDASERVFNISFPAIDLDPSQLASDEHYPKGFKIDVIRNLFYIQ